MNSDDQLTPATHLSIQELPSVIRELFALAGRELLPAARADLFVRYLRRKPGRGLAIIYEACERRPRHQRLSAVRQTISLTLEEQALAGAAIRITPEQARNTSLELPGAGILQAGDLGIALQTFPADSSLPHLANCCDTSSGSPLLEHLQAAARVLLEDKNWTLLTAQAVPIRYKPASRCVIRYDLLLAQQREDNTRRQISLFGKVYVNTDQADAIYRSLQQLYAEQLNVQDSAFQQTPLLPRPLLFVASEGLILNEAISARTPGGELRTGNKALQAHFIRERGGRTVSSQPPAEELRLAASALARLHTSTVALDEKILRSGAKEARRASERAALLVGYYPALASDLEDLAEVLTQRLGIFQPENYRPAHGGFKSSQLLYHDETVSVVDFDGFCRADPALDVGYFLAYLRPSSLWYGRHGARAWFEAAAEIFTTTYTNTLQELGVSHEEAENILLRAQLYTAALLFKIATRRVHRLNSPRTQELAGMLKEIASCLARTRRME